MGQMNEIEAEFHTLKSAIVNLQVVINDLHKRISEQENLAVAHEKRIFRIEVWKNVKHD